MELPDNSITINRAAAAFGSVSVKKIVHPIGRSFDNIRVVREQLRVARSLAATSASCLTRKNELPSNVFNLLRGPAESEASIPDQHG